MAKTEIRIPGIGDLEILEKSAESSIIWLLECGSTCNSIAQGRMGVAKILFEKVLQKQKLKEKYLKYGFGIGGLVVGLLLGTIIWKR